MYMGYNYISITPRTSTAVVSVIPDQFRSYRIQSFETSFTQPKAFVIHPCCCVYRQFLFSLLSCVTVLRCTSLFFRSSVDRHLGCFQFFTIKNKAACTCLYLSFGGNNALTPPGFIPRSRIAGSWSSPANKTSGREFWAISTSLTQDPLLVGLSLPFLISQMPLVPNSLY